MTFTKRIHDAIVEANDEVYAQRSAHEVIALRVIDRTNLDRFHLSKEGDRKYIGDGAYIRHEGQRGVCIYTSDGFAETNTVYIEPSDIQTLIILLANFDPQGE